MKLLHTSDWQLGLRARQVGSRAEDVRRQRLRTAERVADIARREQVDAVVLAGDTFDHPDVDEATLSRAVSILDGLAPIPVYVLPGNHDPYSRVSIWQRRAWRRSGAHVTLLTRPEPVEIGDDLVVLPCPIVQKESHRDPTAWIPRREADDRRVRLGVAHGAIDTLPAGVNFPISASRADECGLDYLALGDWHGTKQSKRWAYSGTHEATSFGEKDAGNVLLVEIDERAEPDARVPRVTVLPVGELTWARYDRALIDETDLEALEGDLEALGLERSLVRLELEVAGALAPSVEEWLGEVQDRSFFLEAQVHVLVAQTGRDVPEGLLRQVDETLASWRQHDGAPDVGFTGVSAEAIDEAREQLRLHIAHAQRD